MAVDLLVAEEEVGFLVGGGGRGGSDFLVGLTMVAERGVLLLVLGEKEGGLAGFLAREELAKRSIFFGVELEMGNNLAIRTF